MGGVLLVIALVVFNNHYKTLLNFKRLFFVKIANFKCDKALTYQRDLKPDVAEL